MRAWSHVIQIRADFWALTKRSVVLFTVNYGCLVPLLTVGKYLILGDNMSFKTSDWPSYPLLAAHNAALTLVHEFGFYWCHRIAHWPRFYKFHKVTNGSPQTLRVLISNSCVIGIFFNHWHRARLVPAFIHGFRLAACQFIRDSACLLRHELTSVCVLTLLLLGASRVQAEHNPGLDARAPRGLRDHVGSARSPGRHCGAPAQRDSVPMDCLALGGEYR